MSSPAPTPDLHTGFSAPGATPTPWEDVVGVLVSAELFWISTVRTDGRPHVTPLPAVWCDGALYFCTGPGEQKAVNLAQEQCALTTGDNRGRPASTSSSRDARAGHRRASLRTACRNGNRSTTATGSSTWRRRLPRRGRRAHVFEVIPARCSRSPRRLRADRAFGFHRVRRSTMGRMCDRCVAMRRTRRSRLLPRNASDSVWPMPPWSPFNTAISPPCCCGCE